MTGHRQADWPPITVHITPDGTNAHGSIAGVSHTVTADTLVVVVVNPHPGPRKTSNAILLAAALAAAGRRSVLWDLADGATTSRTVHPMQPRPAAELYDAIQQQDGGGEVGLARYFHPQPHGFALLPHPGITVDPAAISQLAGLLTTSHECVVIDTATPDQAAWAVRAGDLHPDDHFHLH